MLVLTQPDRAAGRGLKAAASPVKRFALEHGLSVEQPESLKTPQARACIVAARAQVLVVAAYGLLLPRPVLEATPHGALNIHASLLPRWRGAAPIQRALLAGDTQTGISIMRMDAGLDTGPVIAQRAVPIGPEDDAGTLHDRLAELGGQMMVQALQDLEGGRAVPRPQSEAGATYATKLTKEETFLDWRRSAEELERAVRAYRPMPGAGTRLYGEPIKIWRAAPEDASGPAGTVLRVESGGLVVACGKGALRLEELQRPGGRRMPAAEFLRGRNVAAGASLG